jgi:hypothetical protein
MFVVPGRVRSGLGLEVLDPASSVHPWRQKVAFLFAITWLGEICTWLRGGNCGRKESRQRKREGGDWLLI